MTATSLSACGGSSGKTFVGSVTVDPDAAGAVTGIEPVDLTSVSEEIGGYVYGLAEDVDATIVGNSVGAVDGDRGSFAVSGLLPDRDLGRAYVTGSASYTGAYEMVVVSGYTRTSNVGAWDQENFSGEITATIDFHEALSHLDDDHDDDHDHSFDEVLMTAQSVDGRLLFDDVVIYQPQLPALPSTATSTYSGGVAMIDGEDIALRGEIAFGADGMIASFEGTGAQTLVAGGFVAEGDGFVVPVLD